MQLTVQQPDLSQMFGQDSLYSTLYGLQRQDQATANNNQNLGQAQQDQSFQADMHPLDLAAAQANIDHTQALTGNVNAEIPGTQAKSTLLKNQADADSSVPASVRNNKALNEYLATTSMDELKQHEAKAQADMYSPDPQVRATAQKVLLSMPAIQARMMEIRQEGANSAGVAGIQGANQIALEKQQALDGRWNKNSMEYLKFQANAKANFQQQAGIAREEGAAYQASADSATDPQEKQFYLSKVAQAKKDYDTAVYNDYRAKQAAGTAGNASKLNVAPIVGGQNVVDVNTLPTPPEAPQQPGQPAVPDVAQPTNLPPKAGAIVKHGTGTYRFKGGDPKNQSNWEKL